MDTTLLYLGVLLILSGFFSGAEIALISVSLGKIHSLVDKGNKTAKLIMILKSNPQKLLITILIGNNLVNIAASVLTTMWVTENFGNAVLGITTGALTLLILIFGEILPKTFAERFSLQYSFFAVRVILVMQYVLFPFIFVLEKFMNYLIKKSGKTRDQMTEDEIKAIVNIGAEHGAIEGAEQELIANVLDFADTRVSLIMTPRPEIVAINGDSTIDEAIKIFIEKMLSRVPVYKDNLDNIVGILTFKELFKARNNRTTQDKIKTLDLNAPILVPESKLLDDLFKEFQWKRQHMAIVINEHGVISGLATLEDLLEEIVGEITDETDDTNERIEQISENSWRADVSIDVDTLNEVLKTKFDCDEHMSLAFLLLEKFQKIPRRGEDIWISGFQFFIEKMKGNKIEYVRIVKN